MLFLHSGCEEDSVSSMPARHGRDLVFWATISRQQSRVGFRSFLGNAEARIMCAHTRRMMQYQKALLLTKGDTKNTLNFHNRLLESILDWVP